MKQKFREKKRRLLGMLLPPLVFSITTGILTGIVVTVYKLAAKQAVEISGKIYTLLKSEFLILPLVLTIVFAISIIMAYIYRNTSNLKGGGIPTSIGMLRGRIRSNWPVCLVGTFFLSLVSFLTGVPLGTEGPSVQMGTALGSASVHGFRRHKAWGRYTMAGGASAGFAIATGAPVSGMVFALEESHQLLSPIMFIVVSVSIMFAEITSSILSGVLGVNERLFRSIDIAVLQLNELWIPLAIGLVFGVFSVLFLKYYHFLGRIIGKIKKDEYKIFIVMCATVFFGILSGKFISTGHHLSEELFISNGPIYFLMFILIIRTTLTLSANISGITGGIFLPIISIGAVVSAIIANTLSHIGLSNDYYTLIIALGISACISSMMKMPLTAVIFSIEALSCHENIIPIIIVAVVSFVITELFNTKSITDSVLEKRICELNSGHECIHEEKYMTVQKDSFAQGKQIKDILWPQNFYILSLQKDNDDYIEFNVHGSSVLNCKDRICVRYSTYHPEHLQDELEAVFGKQETSEDIKLICEKDMM